MPSPTAHPGLPDEPSGTDGGSACWLVELAGVDGCRYAYRVYAERTARPGDLFWSALHHHDEGPHPRAFDLFDTASIRLIG
ncbi:hypothetical protein FHX73_115102 [Kitasatospora viridis]|uniref:Uncharacterized protein n=1 Tax=Kitasatospora viridis TaxID=281105 RepID=A0A561UPD8_9ACTN|nr:hypothetical protein [Kitasatospora viridis]TWG01210.1 hypothetical protein FHX73_115102 [Kitasatospora viridis]